MKILLLSLALCLCLAACGQPAATPTPNPGEEQSASLPQVAELMRARVVQVSDELLLLLSLDTPKPSLYTVSAETRVIDSKVLKPGDIVLVGHEGMVLESYPAQLPSAVYMELTEAGDDLLGLYKQILLDLLAGDPALSEDIDFIALDLNQVENLSEGDKQALRYLLWMASGTEVREGTMESLAADGLITVEGQMQHLERSILCSIIQKSSEADGFAFTAQKWRSSRGAYGFSGCQAKLEGGLWSYTIGAEFMS